MLKTSFRLIAAAAIGLSSTNAALSQDQGRRVTIPGGTAVVVHLTQDISSSSAHLGDKFGFSAVNDVVANGYIVVAAGAQGIGEIANVEEAGSNAHSGKLGLKFDYIYAVDGEKIRLSQTNNTAEGEGNKGAASTATIASYALLGPLGLFAHNFIHGRDATITPKQTFTMFVDDTVHVEASQRPQHSDNDFAH